MEQYLRSCMCVCVCVFEYRLVERVGVVQVGIVQTLMLVYVSTLPITSYSHRATDVL